MIKKIADAICERRNANDWPCNDLDFDEEMAKVAIKALYEPNEELIKVMLASLDCVPINRCRQQALQVWQNTINAILKENDPTS